MSPSASFADLPFEIRLRILSIRRRQSFRALIKRREANKLFVPRVLKRDNFGHWHWCAARFSTEGDWTSSVRVWITDDSVWTHYNVRNNFAYRTVSQRGSWFEALIGDTDTAARCAGISQPGGSATIHLNWSRTHHWELNTYLTQRSTFSARDVRYCCQEQ